MSTIAPILSDPIIVAAAADGVEASGPAVSQESPPGPFLFGGKNFKGPIGPLKEGEGRPIGLP